MTQVSDSTAIMALLSMGKSEECGFFFFLELLQPVSSRLVDAVTLMAKYK